MIDAYLNQTCTIAHTKGAPDKWGNPTTDMTTASCRFTGQIKQIMGMSGEIVVSMARILLNSDVDISPGDAVTLDGKTWRVEAVSDPRGLDGTVLHRMAYLV